MQDKEEMGSKQADSPSGIRWTDLCGTDPDGLFEAKMREKSGTEDQESQQPNPTGPCKRPHRPVAPPAMGRPEPYQWEFEDYEKAEQQNTTAPPGRARLRGLAAFAVMMVGIFVLSVMAFSSYGLWNLSAGKGEKGSSDASSGKVPLNLGSVGTTQSDSASSDDAFSIPEIAQEVKPSVVTILIYSKSQPDKPINEGSGIILTKDGYIVTNDHVIQGAESITVVHDDGTNYVATITGSDTESDLAVLKIDASNLKPAELGVSYELQVGELAVAIGSAGGIRYQNSVSDGIISGLDREKSEVVGDTMTYIQTTATINPGCSGGPLVNQYGQVVGIVVSKVTSENYERLGFAIPIDEAVPVINQLIEDGEVTGRASLGIQVSAVTVAQAQINNWPTGLIIESIETDTHTGSQGLALYDIITKINGKSVATVRELSEEIARYEPGVTVSLTVCRERDDYLSAEVIDVVLIERTILQSK